MNAEKARKLLLEADESTRRAATILVVCLIAVAIGLLISLVGMSNSWTCELDITNPDYKTLCEEMRSFLGCSRVSGPLRAEVLLDVKGEVKASAYLVCPWDTAISEIKVCIFLATLLGLFLGLRAIGNQSKKETDFYIQSSYFFGFLLAMAAFFDFFSVSAAQSNNEDVCTLSGSFTVNPNVSGEKLECSYWLFNSSGYIGLVCAGLVLYSSTVVKKWKDNLAELEI